MMVGALVYSIDYLGPLPTALGGLMVWSKPDPKLNHQEYDMNKDRIAPNLKALENHFCSEAVSDVEAAPWRRKLHDNEN